MKIVMKDTDGRRCRSERTREALIAACVAVLREGRVPTIVEICERAKCSHRSLFWHFERIESLHSAGLAVILAHLNNLQETLHIISHETQVLAEQSRSA